ncbi:hypothetical protein DL95DRAFT_403992 [Leptodontidium sp. 2 PMI_412]|nr:hypothetical protein DL95DRAFT_403992 [Leptodontidium sp. 2 PMI_412]
MHFLTTITLLLTLTLSTSTLACIGYIATYTSTVSEPHHLLGELWDSSSSSGSEPGQPLCTIDSGLDKNRHFEFKCDVEGVRVYATDLGNRAIYEKLDGEVVRLDALSYGSSGFGIQ